MMQTKNPSYDQYFDQLSKKNTDNNYYIQKIKKYREECGCALGSFFLLAASIIFFGYVFFVLDWSQQAIFDLSLFGFAFILFSAFAGKVIGIGLARIRLILLYKTLIRKRRNQLIFKESDVKLDSFVIEKK